MDNNLEALKALELTLSKYRKNKTMVPKSELETRYKTPFDNLKMQLKSDLQKYIAATVFDGIKVLPEYIDDLETKLDLLYDELHIATQLGTAAFIHMEINEIKDIACTLKMAIKRLYDDYVYKHICLCATAACFAQEAPEAPRIYNPIANKFWNGKTWVPNNLNEHAILICIGEVNEA